MPNAFNSRNRELFARQECRDPIAVIQVENTGLGKNMDAGVADHKINALVITNMYDKDYI